MGTKIILNESLLRQKYISENMSQKAVAKYFGVSVDTIVRNLRDYGIQPHVNRDCSCSPKIQLSDIQKEVLYGALLGDGCLHINKNGINANFFYASKSYQHVCYVYSFFKEYSKGIETTVYYDERTNKSYKEYRFRTCANYGFTDEYNKWYIGGKKHIPFDLKLNPMICLLWYIGDGGLLTLKNSQQIKLSTNSFCFEEQQNILIPQLSEFDAYVRKYDKFKHQDIQQYVLIIPRKHIKDFLGYIGKCPFSDYKYKWNYIEYKNSKPKNHSEKEKIFCEMYKSGMTYYAIAKHFKIEPNAVKYYLVKNNLYKKGKIYDG